jgi:hypothetical protein
MRPDTPTIADQQPAPAKSSGAGRSEGVANTLTPHRVAAALEVT